MEETRESAYIPKNIRQVGDPDFTRKIYVEDYVITYINGIFEGNDDLEKVLLLFGGEATGGPCHYIYVRGAFEVEAKIIDNEKYFSGQDFQKAMEGAKKHFKDLPLIGWALIRQGQPMTLEEKMRTTWEAYMSRIPLFFLGDLLEKEEIFYWKYDGSVKSQPGYYIFYEKNRSMQEYLIERKEKTKWKPEPKETDRVIENFRSRLEEKQKTFEKTKTNTLSLGISVFLMVVVLAIGLTLLNNYEKMDAIQTSVESLLEALTVKEQETAKKHSLTDPVTTKNTNTSAQNTTTTTTTVPTTTEPTTTAPTTTTTTGSTGTPTPPTSASQTTPSQATLQPEVTVTPLTHTVKKGETLLSISLAVYGNANMVDEICEKNHISDPDAILEGQIIQLP